MKKHSNVVNKPRKLSEAKLRKIVQEELIRSYLVQEGIWDDVQSGAKKLSDYVSKQFKAIAAKWADAIKEKLSYFDEMPQEIKQVIGILQTAMKESGESIKLDEGLQAAKQLGSIGVKGALSIVEEDFAGPVKEKASELQGNKTESFDVTGVYRTLSDASYTKGVYPRGRLHEMLGVTTVVGILLATIGGLPMLFKGLHSLANKLHAEKSAELFEKAEKVTHHFEQKVITGVVPDKLAYHVYAGLWKLGIHLTHTKEPYNEIEIKVEKGGPQALVKAKNLLYKMLLIYFAWSGFMGVLHAGASLLGFVEGGATAVKGIELARGASEIAKLAIAGQGAAAATI